MAGFFKRLFRIVQSEAHSAVEQLEDPIKMTEQGIRDLKQDLQASMTSLAQVKSIAIRLKKDLGEKKRSASDYERKAMLLLQKMQRGELDKNEAEQLATESLGRKNSIEERSKTLQADYRQQQKMADQLQAKVNKLKHTITSYENELVTLKARAKTASSMRKINQQLANVDSSSTINLLEKMKQKVEEEEALAQAYGDVAATEGIDDDIDRALEAHTEPSESDSLAELKKKMGIES